MIEKITAFLESRLKDDLPYSNIENEDLDDLLKKFIIKEQTNPTKTHRVCATMIALFEENGAIYFPCILRPQKSRVHPGQIAFPGGGWEKADEDLSDTAIRETLEEVGVIVPKSQVLGDLTDMYVPPSNSMITPKVGFLKERPIYNIDPNKTLSDFSGNATNEIYDQQKLISKIHNSNFIFQLTSGHTITLKD